MMPGLDKALEFLLAEEGGWSNHPSDRGGATMFGVTQKTYNAYRKLKTLPKVSVRGITQAEARDLYDLMYWREAGCDRLPWPISYLTFDAAVNSGPSPAQKWTQQGLGVAVDGVVGANTVRAAQQAVDEGDSRKILGIVDARVTFLARLVQRSPSQADFLLGWWRRTLRVLGRALISNQQET